MRIAVIGGANIDIGGFSSAEARMRDSNPGRVRISPGGVGRNIAANLALLGANTELITALGGDDRAQILRADCKKLGVKLNHAISFPDAATSTYLYIANADGDMLIAVNDMAIHERLTPEALSPLIAEVNRCDAAVIEANLPAETLEFLSKVLSVPIVADAVSAAKVDRLKGALPRLYALKPNRIEAEKLTGDNIYKVLIYFDKLYAVMSEQEKRQIMESLISEIQIYSERQPNGQWLKSIKFKLPIIEEDMSLSLDNDEHVETVALLSRETNPPTAGTTKGACGTSE